MAQPHNVRRYRSGVVPEFATKEEEKATEAVGAFGKTSVPSTPKAGPLDKRLQRLNISDASDHTERLARHRRIIEEAAILGTDETTQTEIKQEKREIIQPELITEEEAIEERKKRLQKALELKQVVKKEEEEEGSVNEEDEEGSGEEGDDEDDSDESDDEEEDEQWGLPSKPTIQPRFVPKENRASIADKEKQEKEEELKRQEKARENEERKNRTLTYLKEDKAREAEAAVGTLEEEDVNTDDEEKDDDGQSKEFEEWQLRELRRVRRDREAREKIVNEKADIEARRSMTDEQVMAEKIKLFGVKQQKKVKFLQKYYHKGAFYHDELEEIEKTKAHDWTAPTGEDKFVDKADLPAVLQVKNFGRSSRTKYTHLKNEDTSKLTDEIWAKRVVPDRIQKSLGGAGVGFDRPTKKRKIETQS